MALISLIHPGSVRLGTLTEYRGTPARLVQWKSDGFEYRKEGKTYRYDLKTGQITEVGASAQEESLSINRGH
jgi:hypothetical protein